MLAINVFTGLSLTPKRQAFSAGGDGPVSTLNAYCATEPHWQAFRGLSHLTVLSPASFPEPGETEGPDRSGAQSAPRGRPTPGMRPTRSQDNGDVDYGPLHSTMVW